MWKTAPPRMPTPSARNLISPVESQRDSVSKPWVASRELPWVGREIGINPNGVVPIVPREVPQPRLG